MKNGLNTKKSLGYEDDVLKLEEVKRVVKSIRNLRAEMNIHPSQKSKLFIKTNREYKDVFVSSFFSKLAFASEVEFIDEDLVNTDDYTSVVTANSVIYIALSDLIDIEKEVSSKSRSC